MTIAHIFKRPGLYLGTGFNTIDEFRIFMSSISFVDRFSPEEQAALRAYPEFVVRYYHGSFENRSWPLELLYDHRDHDAAIKAGMIMFLKLVSLIREKGGDHLPLVLQSAQELGRFNPHSPPDRLESLIDDATVMKNHFVS